MEVVIFENLPQMLASSDLVIEGMVQEVEPGRVLGEGDAAIQFAQVTLAVDRVLSGRMDAASVVLEEYGLERATLHESVTTASTSFTRRRTRPRSTGL